MTSMPKDGHRGIMLPNRSWTGIVDELHRREIVFAFTYLGRNYHREQVMDYSDYNVFTYYIAGIYKLPSSRITSMNMYLQPFTFSVFMCILV